MQDRKKVRPLGSSRSLKLVANLFALLLLVGALALQWRAASFSLGNSLENDEPKHFTSGVMVYDYLRTGLASDPIRFAESFEVRYPLLAIGHWPPMYYAVQGVYYFFAGPSIRSARVLSALIATGLALTIFLSLRARACATIALVAAAVFLAMPLVQDAAWRVMSDLLTAFFVYLAILAFSKLLDDPDDGKALLAFAAAAVAGLLTKGSAWALVPFLFLAPLLARRNRVFRSRWFLGALLLVVLLGASFYLVAARWGIGYPARLSHYLGEQHGHRLWILAQLLRFAPATLIALSALGGWIALRDRWRRGDTSPSTTLSLAAAAWIASQLVFLMALPMTSEPRVLLPSLAPAVVLMAGALRWMQSALRAKPLLAAALPALLGTIVILDAGPIPRERSVGYREAADAMAYPPGGALILIATDTGEQQVLTERLSHNRAHTDVILRGTHVLGRVDVLGHDQPLFSSPEAVRSFLLEMPVRYIVLNNPPFEFSYQELVQAAVTGDPQDFHLISSVPVLDTRDQRSAELLIYENPAGRDHHPTVVRTPLGYDAGRRMLEYRWK